MLVKGLVLLTGFHLLIFNYYHQELSIQDVAPHTVNNLEQITYSSKDWASYDKKSQKLMVNQSREAVSKQNRTTFKFAILFPTFIALSMGLSLHNTIAVIQGWWGKESPFVRTPKFNINGIKDTFRKQKYFQSTISWTTIFEGLLAIYFAVAVVIGWQLEDYTFLAYHVLLMTGFGTIFYYSIRHLNLR